MPEQQEPQSFGRGAEDFKLADWLSIELNNEWRYDHTAKKWHHWNGSRWAPDDTGQVLYAVATKARKARYFGLWSRDDPRSQIGTDGDKALSALQKVPAQLRALTALATFPGYGTNGDDWDSDPFTLGVKNGIVDLRTNSLVPNPSPANLVTKTTGVKFEAVNGPSEFAKRAPIFMRVLSEWMTGDENMMYFLLFWFGASLFGFSPEQRFLLMTGRGRNGKGALMKAVLSAVGEYGEELDPALYMRSKMGTARSNEARADLMDLKGLRVSFFSEPSGGRFNEEMLKGHTGGDRITARALYSNNVQSWDPTHSITFLTNALPEVEDVGPSMGDRVMVADFRESYEGPKMDRKLYDKLESEAEGILAILCWAARVWYFQWNENGGGLVLPERVIEQSRQFMERNDPVAQALDEVFVIGRDLKGAGKLIYDTYLDWHSGAGRDDDPLSMTRFFKALENKGFHKIRGHSANYWVGLKPMGAMEAAERDDGDEGDG